MSVESLHGGSLDLVRLDKDSKAEGERRMITPWRARIVVGPEAVHYYCFLLV
jgi:hypothetical protein